MTEPTGCKCDFSKSLLYSCPSSIDENKNRAFMLHVSCLRRKADITTCTGILLDVMSFYHLPINFTTSENMANRLHSADCLMVQSRRIERFLRPCLPHTFLSSIIMRPSKKYFEVYYSRQQPRSTEQAVAPLYLLLSLHPESDGSLQLLHVSGR